ncbi:MAG TPA: hypothetical protein VHW47_10255 [Acidimicrobiales bacterium]|jgi:hypothetical protein|nr:hypothetical protein [Acidimicrobiales bacterium]
MTEPRSHRRTARRVFFWGGVAVVSVLANFGVELAATRLPSLGLKRFVGYTHKGKT